MKKYRPVCFGSVVAMTCCLAGVGDAWGQCCQNEADINLHNTGCDFIWAGCNVGCALDCCFGACPNSGACNSCKTSCNSNRNSCKDNGPDCVECQDVGESCEIISTYPLGPGKCKDGLNCYFLNLTEAVCGPPKNGGDLFDQNLCVGLYSSPICEIQDLDPSPRTVTFGTSAGAACADAVEIVEVGNIYGRDGDYGCYKTTCSGVQFDCSAGIGVVSGYYTQDFADIAGTDHQSCEEIGSPFANVSSGLCQVFQDVPGCTECCPDIGFESEAGECDEVGGSNSISFGLGFSPVTISFLDCFTETILVGTMNDDCTLDVITGNQAPTCDAGGPYLIECGNPTTSSGAVSASGSSDPDADSLTYLWTTNCPGGSFSSNTAEMPTLTMNSDCCNNCSVTLAVSDGTATSTCQATVGLVDTNAPTLTSSAANSTVECDGSGNAAALADWLGAHGGAVATDTCGAVTFSNDYTALSDTCGATGSAEVTFTAADACGLSDTDCQDGACSTTTATFEIQDTTPPEIETAAANLTVECDGAGNVADLNGWLNTNGGAAATDVCGGFSWSNDFDGLSYACGTTGSATVMFTATDDCLLSSPTGASFAIEDTTSPDLFVDTTRIVATDLECAGAVNVVLPDATGSDVCGGVTISDDRPIDFTAGAVTPVTYTAEDECGNTTSDVLDIAILYGSAIHIEATQHTVGQGAAPGSSKAPLVGIEVCGYDKSDGSCARDVCGGISHQHYQCIVDNCTPTNCCTNPDGTDALTDDNGECMIDLPPGNYLVISADATKTVLPDPLGVSAGGLECGQVKTKHLQQIVKANGKKVPGKTTRLTGSELLIIEPEFVVWDDVDQLYPFVFESVGDWGVTASVSPPEGFISDYEALSAVVDNELEAVQFTITEVGSDLEPTGTTFDVTHKGRNIKVKSSVGIYLTPGYARSRGFDPTKLRARGLIKERQANRSKGKQLGRQ